MLDGGFKMPLPTVLGHEGAGVVEAVGPEVRPAWRWATTWCSHGFRAAGAAATVWKGPPGALCGFGRVCSGRGGPVRMHDAGGKDIHQFLGPIGGFAERVLVRAEGVIPIAADVAAGDGRRWWAALC